MQPCKAPDVTVTALLPACLPACDAHLGDDALLLEGLCPLLGMLAHEHVVLGLAVRIH